MEFNMIELIESPTKKFSDIQEANDYLNGRDIQTFHCMGNRMSLDAPSGQLLIKGNTETKAFPIRDTGIEGILGRTGLGNGSFPNTICNDELLQHNINYLFTNMVADKIFTVIIEDGEFKALMSKGYSFVNHKTVLDIINNLGMDLKIHGLSISKDLFRACVTNPTNLVKFKVDDISSVGIDITNSENGQASLTLARYLNRYWCTNGASFIDEKSAHRSRAIHRGNEIYQVLKAFNSAANDYLTNGAEIIEAQFEVLANTEVTEPVLNKIANKVETVVGKKDTETLVDEWNKSIKVVACDEKEWQEKDYTKYENNAYDLMQLVTKAAHRDFDGIKQAQLERVGGSIISSVA